MIYAASNEILYVEITKGEEKWTVNLHHLGKNLKGICKAPLSADQVRVCLGHGTKVTTEKYIPAMQGNHLNVTLSSHEQIKSKKTEQEKHLRAVERYWQ